MARNAAGVYSLPDSPVVAGTTITAVDENTTRSDMAAELTNSLDRNGRGAMLAPLQLFDGVLGQPGLTWGSDTNTGIYRSAADTMVLVAGATAVVTITTSGISIAGTVSGVSTLTATASVVTPLITTASAVPLDITIFGERTWRFDTNAASGNSFFPTQDNVQNIGKPSARVFSVFTTSVDSGVSGSLSLKTNNGTTQVSIDHTGSAVNTVNLAGGSTGNAVTIDARGSDSNPGIDIRTKGTGTIGFRTDVLTTNVIQFQVLHTASSSRNITVTGSNGGNPTISTTAGSLAITPAVVIAGASLQVGTNPASTGALNTPYAGGVYSRNQANGGDIGLIISGTKNSVVDTVQIGLAGSGSNGVFWQSRSGAGAPTILDLPSGAATVWRDTTGATTKVYYNNAGTIIASAAFV